MTQNADHGKRHAGEVAVRVADKRFRWVPVREAGGGGQGHGQSQSGSVTVVVTVKATIRVRVTVMVMVILRLTDIVMVGGRARETRSQTQSRLELAVGVFGASPGTDQGPGLAVSSVTCGNAITLSHVTVMKNNERRENTTDPETASLLPVPSPYVSPTDTYPRSLWKAGPDPIPHQLWQVQVSRISVVGRSETVTCLRSASATRRPAPAQYGPGWQLRTAHRCSRSKHPDDSGEECRKEKCSDRHRG